VRRGAFILNVLLIVAGRPLRSGMFFVGLSWERIVTAMSVEMSTSISPTCPSSR
jgi:hypothetical protein